MVTRTSLTVLLLTPRFLLPPSPPPHPFTIPSTVCDCVMDKDNNCVTDRLNKLGLLEKEPAVNHYVKTEL